MPRLPIVATVVCMALAFDAATAVLVTTGDRGAILIEGKALLCANYTAFSMSFVLDVQPSLCGKDPTTLAPFLSFTTLTTEMKRQAASAGYFLDSDFMNGVNLAAALLAIPVGFTCEVALTLTCQDTSTSVVHRSPDGTFSLGNPGLNLCGIDDWGSSLLFTQSTDVNPNPLKPAILASVPCDAELVKCQPLSLRLTENTARLVPSDTATIADLSLKGELSRGRCPSKLVDLQGYNNTHFPYGARLTPVVPASSGTPGHVQLDTHSPRPSPPEGVNVINIRDPSNLICLDNGAVDPCWVNDFCPASATGNVTRSIVPIDTTRIEEVFNGTSYVPFKYWGLDPSTDGHRLGSCATLGTLADPRVIESQLIARLKPVANCSHAVAVNCSSIGGFAASSGVPAKLAGMPLCDVATGAYRLASWFCWPRIPAGHRFRGPQWGPSFATWDDHGNNRLRDLLYDAPSFSASLQRFSKYVTTNKTGIGGLKCDAFDVTCESRKTYRARTAPNHALEYVDNSTNTTVAYVDGASYFDQVMAQQFCDSISRSMRFWPSLFGPNVAFYKTTLPPGSMNITKRFAFTGGLCLHPWETNQPDRWYTYTTPSCDPLTGSGAATLEVPSSSPTQVYAVECTNVEYETRVTPASPPSTLELEDGDWFGTLEVRRKPRSPEDDSPWVGVSAEDPVWLTTPYFFSDEAALGFCRYNKSAYASAADAVVSPNPSATADTGFTEFYCVSRFFSEHDGDDPLNRSKGCYYRTGMSPPYSLPSTASVRIRCGAKPTGCPTFTSPELAGTYCSINSAFQTVIQLSFTKRGFYVAPMNASRAPFSQNFSGTSNLFVGNLTGHSCRVGLRAQANSAWAHALKRNITSFPIYVTAIPRVDPYTGTKEPSLHVVHSTYLPLEYARCNNCPLTPPVGQYCDKLSSGYISVEKVKDMEAMYQVRVFRHEADRLEICTVPIDTNSTPPGLPGSRCLLQLTENCPQGLSSRNLVYFSNALTLGDDTKNGVRLFDFCHVSPPAVCPVRLSGQYCGESREDSNRRMRLVFHPDDSTYDLYYNAPGGESVVCDDEPYGVRNLTSGAFCAVDVPVFGDFEGCLNETSSLHMSMQNRDMFEYLVEKDSMILHLLNDTFDFKHCPNCEAANNISMCAESGWFAVDFGGETATPDSYAVTTYAGAKQDKDARRLAETKPKEGLVEHDREQTCVYYLNREDGTAIGQWLSLLFDSSGSASVKVNASRSTEVMKFRAVDTLHVCSTVEIPPNRYCTSSETLDYTIQITDRLNAVVQPSGGGPGIAVNYWLTQNRSVLVSAQSKERLTNDSSVWNDVNLVVFVDDERGIVALVSGHGYVNFPPCASITTLQILMYVVIGVAAAATLVFIIKNNIANLRAARARAARKVAAAADLTRSFGPSVSEKFRVHRESFRSAFGPRFASPSTPPAEGTEADKSPPPVTRSDGDVGSGGEQQGGSAKRPRRSLFNVSFTAREDAADAEATEMTRMLHDATDDSDEDTPDHPPSDPAPQRSARAALSHPHDDCDQLALGAQDVEWYDGDGYRVVAVDVPSGMAAHGDDPLASQGGQPTTAADVVTFTDAEDDEEPLVLEDPDHVDEDTGYTTGAVVHAADPMDAADAAGAEAGQRAISPQRTPMMASPSDDGTSSPDMRRNDSVMSAPPINDRPAMWQLDKDVKQCNGCKCTFGVRTRRHHCRACGMIFCNKCSSRTMKLNMSDAKAKAVRVCDGCFEHAQHLSPHTSADSGL